MHGIYTLQSLNSDTTAPINRKILSTISALVASFLILVLGAALIWLQPVLSPPLFRHTVFIVFFLLAGFSSFVLLVLSYLLRSAFFPLNELILWAKRADNLETIPVPPNVSREISDIYEVFNLTLDRLKANQRREAGNERERALVALASQVAHDIRSPLSALSLVSDALGNLPEDRRVLIRSAITRIQDIANNLLSKYRSYHCPGLEKPTVESLSVLTESLLSEKRAQFRTRPELEIVGQMENKAYGLFAQVRAVDFQNILSNLINNAIEATPAAGRIEVDLQDKGPFACVHVRDQGVGIPETILSRLTKERLTYGKQGGSGLGLYHARSLVEAWGGHLELKSGPKGTQVSLCLPKAPPPAWFIPELKLSARSTILVVDDDSSIHHTWDKKFSALPKPKSIRVKHFFSQTQLMRWFEEQHHRPAFDLCLMDYEFIGSKQNGIQLIQTLGIGARSVLVTSRYEEQSLLSECERLQLPVLPKAMVRFVPVMAEA